MFTANRFFSIKGKLMLFYGVVYLCFALSFTFIYYIFARNTLMEIITLQMDNTLKGINTVVQTSINTAVKSYLRFNAESNYSALSDDGIDSSALDLMEEIQNSSDIDNYIIDSEGVLISSRSGIEIGTSLWYERDSKGSFYIQNLISKAYSLPSSGIDSTFHYEESDIVFNVFSFMKSRQWIIVSSIPRSRLQKFIDVNDFRNDIVSLTYGRNGSVEIFDSKGLQIVHSAKQFEGNLRDTETHRIMLEEKNGQISREERLAEVSSLEYVTTSAKSRKDEMISKIYSFNTIPDMGWMISVGVDRAEVFSPLKNLLLIIIIITILSFIILAGLSILASEWFIMKNLRLLTKAIGVFENKKFDTRVDISSGDEIETLSRSFNSMAETIEEYSDHMEQIIIERTRDLLQSEKMAALGGLVAGIAHEINTPIGITVTASSYIKNEVEAIKISYHDEHLSKKEIERFFHNIEEASDIIFNSTSNAGELIQRFKKIAVDQSVEEPRPFLFKEYLDDVVLSLKPEFKKWNIDLDIKCDSNLILVSDPGYFYQILYNLFLNSLNHGFSTGDNVRLSVRAEFTDRNFVLTYRDNGKGIDETALPHIFEPFYTTKRGHGGTGLGLHIIFNIVSQTLGGTIICTSNDGVCFTITIPIGNLK